MKRWTLIAATAASLLLAPLAQALDLQGHRGTRGLAPENTLASFAKALGIGVTTLETDIAITRDGVLVISHDSALNPDITRGPDGQYIAGRGPVIHHTAFDEIRRYDVGRIKPGTRYAGQFPEQVPVDGARLPTLDELFALVKKSGNTEVRFALETKLSPGAPDETAAPEPFARALIAAVRAAGMAQRTSILSFDWRTLQVVQREAPEIITVYLTAQQRWLDNVGANDGASPWTAGYKLREHGGSVPRLIHAAGGKVWKALGIQVLAWTVNEPALMGRILDLGVDGLITDRADLARTVMAQRGLPLPRTTPVTP
ncbi:MAG: glycerophosphodiester phosphodiesterase [Alphaproteobacteria bacterium PA3]|nr:MAG: glycerophosphodiester phosphodiesterase [Alphaproteobacteria bacterium PA3]